MAQAASRSWDIFCSVVDNYGDIGVCWRLARILRRDLGQTVRLWIDDLNSFHRLCHVVDPEAEAQCVSGVDIRHWTPEQAAEQPADIVVEGFGVRLSERWQGKMAARNPRPVWINLEYLSAESWVESCHGLPSPHASLPLTKHFFFPGFTSNTGGLLIERDLEQRRERFQRDQGARDTFFQSLGVRPAEAGALRVSLFCYEQAPLEALLGAWVEGAEAVDCVVPEGPVWATLARISGRNVVAGERYEIGKLTVSAIPFLEVDQYDELLWSCDVNFVRGEDSFVRAQLAARPMIWQAYPQANEVHLDKVSAFLERYCVSYEEPLAMVYRDFTLAWNGGQAHADWRRLWSQLRTGHAALAAQAREWARQLQSGGNLVQKLAAFCETRLK